MKLVREHINEKFTEEGDPIHDMGIGQITLIKNWLKKQNNNDYKYSINDDGTIDIYGLYIQERPIRKFPEYIQFNYCNGPVSLTDKGFKTLKGFPYTMSGDLYLGKNNLTSLKYCPHGDIRSLMIFDNKLTSLKGCPSKVGQDFNCRGNPLKSLDYMPKYIGHNFICFPDGLLTLSEEYIKNYIDKNKIFIGGKRIITRAIAQVENYID